MEVTIKKPKSYIREIEVSFPSNKLAKEQEKIAQNYRHRVVIPGFRKGKAPVSVIMNRFKKEIQEEAKDNVIKSAFTSAVKENNLNPITFVDIKDIKIPEEKGTITFRASFQVIPDFELKLDGIKVICKKHKISKKDVRKVVSDLQRKYTALKPASNPSREGNVIEFDYEVSDMNGKKIDAVSYMTIEYRKEKYKASLFSLLDGVKPGDKIEGEIGYPKIFPVIELHGKPIKILLEVREVKEKVVPKIDDSFAKLLGLSSLKELEESIYKQLSEENEIKTINSGQEELIEKLLHNNNFEVPDALVSYYLKQQKQRMKDAKQEDYDEDELQRMAVRKAQLNIILDRIAETQKIEARNDEIEEIIEKEATNESIRKEELKKYLIESGRLEDIISILKREKALIFLQENFLIKT